MSLDIVLPMSLDSFVTYVPDRFKDSCGPVDSERKQPYSAFSGNKCRAASLNNLGVLFPLLSSSNNRLLFKPSSLHHITPS